MLTKAYMTRSLQDVRIARVLQEAVQAVEPGALVVRALGDLVLPRHRRIFVLGLGKAAEAMTRSAVDELQGVESALLITKHQTMQSSPRFTVLEAGHPIPDERSMAAGRAALNFVEPLREDDLLICLISGGGSALATVPMPGLSLRDLQALTSAALASGGSIEDVNILRRQLDLVKGGGLARATRANVLSLILSDVVGDRLEAIASGPTVPNPTGTADAHAVLKKLDIPVPNGVRSALESDAALDAPAYAGRTTNIVIGNGALAAQAALRTARREGLDAELLDSGVQGEARQLGEKLAGVLVSALSSRARPFCLVAAGESTVTLTDHGKGGRNQELALAAVDVLDGAANCVLVSLATDGNDGPTDAAGGVATGTSRSRAASLGLQSSDYLARHDAYRFFEALGDLLKPGYTGTNVNDLMLLCGL